MAINPVSPVSAPLAPLHVDRTHDAGKHVDAYVATPSTPRATLAKTVKAWRSYSKGGKKKYVQPQRKKTAREEIAALLENANGVQLVAESKINDTQSRKRRERRERVEGAAAALHGVPRLVDIQQNPARRADAQRLRVESKGAAAGRPGGRGSATARDEAAREVADHRAKLAAARLSIEDVSIALLKQAANSPLGRMPEILGISGLAPEAMYGLCAEVLDAQRETSLGMACVIGEPHPDMQAVREKFAALVRFAVHQNDRGVPPGDAIAIGMERAGTAALIAASSCLVMPWPGPDRGVMLPAF